MKRAVRIFLLSGILLNTAALFAEETPAFEFERFNFYFENDIFDKTDKNYTSGLKFSAIYQVDTNAYRYLEMPFIHDKTKNHFLTLLIGQEIYTPEDTDSAIPNPEDQPYAGWLYAGFALQQANSREADTLELQLGVVGPAALGEQTQNFMHTVTASRSSNGWDYQLHNEPGIVLAYEHRWRYLSDALFSGLDADAIPYAGFAL
ncbi:MAG: lipid A deacylase LpxR family protein, partial [Thiovulaceae bacterium]|nr:lipid A deacylase LpxR family protein [Sulfurimonadaceae bacterium]